MDPPNTQTDHNGATPDNRMHRVEVKVAIGLLIVAYAAVALRVFARYKSEMSFGPDDWFIIAAVFAVLPFGIGIFAGDMGLHISDIQDKAHFLRTWLLTFVSYAIATALTKISILCFYYRIFANKKLKHLVYCVSAWTILYNIALIVVSSIVCYAIPPMWTGRPAKIVNVHVPVATLGIINFLTDVFILCIPVYFVRRLRVTLVRKAQIGGIFLTGAVVCVFGIIRVTAHERAGKGNIYDTSYNETLPAIWSLCEACVGILAACLPTLGFYFAQSLNLNDFRKVWTMSWLRHRFRSKSRDEPVSPVLPEPATIQKTVDFTVSSFPMDRDLVSIDRMTISSGRNKPGKGIQYPNFMKDDSEKGAESLA